jgi:hypothetical protein
MGLAAAHVLASTFEICCSLVVEAASSKPGFSLAEQSSNKTAFQFWVKTQKKME